MTDEQKTTVKAYVTGLNNNIEDDSLLDLVVQIVSDRVLLYLNETEIANSMLTTLAQVIVSVYKRTEAESASMEADKAISTVSDNGQSVSYVLTPTQYMSSKSDQELFTGFERLLSRYRRISVFSSTEGS